MTFSLCACATRLKIVIPEMVYTSSAKGVSPRYAMHTALHVFFFCAATNNCRRSIRLIAIYFLLLVSHNHVALLDFLWWCSWSHLYRFTADCVCGCNFMVMSHVLTTVSRVASGLQSFPPLGCVFYNPKSTLSRPTFENHDLYRFCHIFCAC